MNKNWVSNVAKIAVGAILIGNFAAAHAATLNVSTISGVKGMGIDTGGGGSGGGSGSSGNPGIGGGGGGAGPMGIFRDFHDFRGDLGPRKNGKR